MMDEKKDKANEQTLTKSVLILPNKQISDLNNTSQYCHLDNSSNSSVSCVPKLSVHYIVSLNNESLISSCKSSTAESSAKLETIDCERKCLISLPIDGHHTDCELIKGHHSVANQRLLISPTDFLTLSEEGVTHKSSAVRKDVNLSTSSVELIRRSNSDNNFAICLDRYCESPLLLEHKDSQLICEDETSCNGRNSRLSETPEDMTADELFASTFGGDQSNSLREVVTPIEVDSARNTPTLLNKDSNNTKTKSNLETLLCEDIKPNIEAIGTKPVLTILDPLETETNNNDCSSSQSHSESSFSLISSRADSTASPSQSLSLATLDIKVLPTGLLAKDSILLANLAAALPSSLTSRQIAVQVIREDGTSLVLPINTKHDSSGSVGVTPKQVNSDLAVSTSVVLAEMVAPNASIRPFKCELCNSTFTRLGNYTRHKKIHSFPSKEDQRFRCDICNKSFIQRCDLARHLHIHRGTEPHRCSQCGKGYIRHSDLVTHQRFHNKEKPFSCPHCSKGFCQRGDLNRHLRSIHLQLKPILCSHCHKKFAKEETLLRHINANHRELIEEATDPQFK